jgi:5-methylcytosine-specific restriction protein A
VVVGGGRCPACARASSTARGYTKAWSAYSRRFLLTHPHCGDRDAVAPATTHSRCAALGLIVASQVTDHIVPHRGDFGLMWSASNHQALCARCHGRKTATEDGGFGR